MNDAVHEFRVLRENPVQKIKIPKQVDKPSKVAHFTREQLESFLDCVKAPVKNAKYQHTIQYYAFFTLLARTRLRVGEALALTWDDLDFDAKTLTVHKTLFYPLDSQPYLSTPKSKSSERTIKLDEITIKQMKRHRINQKEVCLMYKNYKPTKDNIIFHQHEGRWLRTNVVCDYFKEICKRAELPVLSPHAVHLLEVGANIKYVSERLGHASVKVTADTYLHVTKKIEDDALVLYERYVQK
ncbi:MULTISPECIES: site-specific integrase [Bacillales]|uniref:site-specific integrase n=1 Tax=Bacillales TaxID=1385 RepID=UPI0003490F3C|nr:MULTISPECIES: site-specific integrase [Bacillales]KMZ44441.1 integrase [Bacillus sp. FJAT-27238]